LAQKLFVALFPLNPAIWWAERRLCFERELACDEGVLAELNSPAEYAMSLTNLAELSFVRRKAMLVLGAWQARSELSVRVHRILSGTVGSRKSSTAIALVVTLVVSAGGFLLGRTPSLVGFSNAESPAAVRVANAQVAMNVAPQLMTQPVREKSDEVGVSKRKRTRAKPLEERKELALARTDSAPAQAPPVVLPAALPTTPYTGTHVDLVSYAAAKSPRSGMFLLEDARHAYAAFRLADGWLLIQL
ncbi:MAG: hypothetical protein ABI142_02785, partial [Bryocella sp.]